MTIIIAIRSDVICPWCWIGKRRLEQALAALPDLSVHITWHPFQLNPDLPQDGLPRAEYRAKKFGSAAYAQALDARVSAVAATVGLAFDLAAQTRTPHTLLAHRLIWFAAGQGMQDAVVEALFSAYFTAGMDVGDPLLLSRVAASTGLDQSALERFLASQEGEEEVLASCRAARAEATEGVPLFIIGGHERISGAQPVETFIAVLSQASGIIPPDAADDCTDGICRN